MVHPPQSRLVLHLAAAMLGAAACRAPSVADPDQSAPPGAPDQVAIGASMALNASGGLRQALVTADSALVFQQAQRIEFRGMKVIVFDQRSDQASVLTAKRGAYSIRTGAIDASGDVTVTNDRKARLSTPRLTFDARGLQYRNDTTYVFDPGTGAAVTGRKLSADVRLVRVRGSQD